MNLVTFQYNLVKDAENFIRGMDSINNKQLTKLQEEYELLYGKDFPVEKVEKFLEDRTNRLGIKFQQIIPEFAKRWELIEIDFVSRCEKLFGVELTGSVIAFLSQNQRCTYRLRENYFFIYYDSVYPSKTIMHELLHFFTHKKYENLKIEPKKFNDIKESLTVLLNRDFADLMAETEDWGYPQHQEMRQDIIRMRERGLSLDEIVHNLAGL